jgi:ectoine hydroxylase-related dioxygenase (phytanoyl-CoA dioxygenase family)
MRASQVVRKDINEIVAEVDKSGVCVVPDFISTELLKRIEAQVDHLNELERARGVGFLESEGANQRVFNLVNKGEVFEKIVQHPDVMAVMGILLGGDFILSGFSSNTTGPGGEEMVLHSDSGYVPPPHPEYLLAANAIWMIDDFTSENGATHYVPGSHKLRSNPGAEKYDTKPILGKAGSVAFLHGYTWHKTGSNTSAANYRRALFAYYVRPFLRVQENHVVSVREEVWNRASPLLRHLLGGDMWLNSLGFFDGPPKTYREAAFARRNGPANRFSSEQRPPSGK